MLARSLATIFFLFLVGSSSVMADIITITTPQQLDSIGINASMPLSGSYVLGADINATGFGDFLGFRPIGSTTNSFTGVLDGAGHTITGLRSTSLGGLFGAIGSTGLVENLGLINVSLNPASRAGESGALAATNAGTISHTFVTGSVGGDGVGAGTTTGYLGGLVGTNYGLIKQSYTSSNVALASAVGGLVGGNFGTVMQSYSTGSVSNGQFVGGLVGWNQGVVSQSYSTSMARNGDFSGGGLVGIALSGSATTNSYWDIQTTGQTSSSGGTAISDSQLKSGILPTGFDPAAWSSPAGQYPKLNWELTLPKTPVEPPILADLSVATFGAPLISKTSLSLVSPIVDGFTEQKSVIGDGNFAAKVYTNGTQVVVAFRGTDPGFTVDNIVYGSFQDEKNILADTSFTTGVPNQNLRDEVRAAATLVSDVSRQYDGQPIILTGWSLGGAIAQLLGLSTGLPAVAFNAPGAGVVFSQLSAELGQAPAVLGAGTLNVNYRIDGDLVSKAGQPIGIQATLDPGFAPTANGLGALHDIRLLADRLKAAQNGEATPSIGSPSPSYIPPLLLYPTTVSIAEKIFGGLVEQIEHFRFSITERCGIDAPDFSISCSGSHYHVDPPAAANYLFDESPGSPLLSSLTLPLVYGVFGYEVAFQIGSIWSDDYFVMPQTPYLFPAGVNGFRVMALDQFLNSTSIDDALAFDLTFVSIGEVDANLTLIAIDPTASDGVTVPEPSSVRLLSTAVIFLLLMHLGRWKFK